MKPKMDIPIFNSIYSNNIEILILLKNLNLKKMKLIKLSTPNLTQFKLLKILNIIPK